MKPALAGTVQRPQLRMAQHIGPDVTWRWMNDDIRHRASERVPFPSDLFPSGVTLIGLKHGNPSLRRTINGPECPGAWIHDVLEVQQRVIDGITRLASTAYLLYSCF